MKKDKDILNKEEDKKPEEFLKTDNHFREEPCNKEDKTNKEISNEEIIAEQQRKEALTERD